MSSNIAKPILYGILASAILLGVYFAMKYIRFIMIGLAAIFLIAGQPSKQEWETKIDDQPPVTIKITPVELGMAKGVQTWKFDVAFDTHSVELDQDLMQIAMLVDDKGNEYKSTAIELKIKDVGGIPERSFKWDIK